MCRKPYTCLPRSSLGTAARASIHPVEGFRGRLTHKHEALTPEATPATLKIDRAVPCRMEREPSNSTTLCFPKCASSSARICSTCCRDRDPCLLASTTSQSEGIPAISATVSGCEDRIVRSGLKMGMPEGCSKYRLRSQVMKDLLGRAQRGNRGCERERV